MEEAHLLEQQRRRNENPILLRDEIDEKSHKLLHLKRSQEELQEMMRTIHPMVDQDLSTAYHENREVILKIENEIHGLKDILIEIDPAYALESALASHVSKNEDVAGDDSLPNETQGIYL
jgi:DNA repair exonuclease SbcCD ATPase subunit